MTQISRPFQIALAAVVVLFALWFAVLRGHSSGSESSSSAAAPSAQPATAPQASGSSSSPAGSSGSSGSTPTTGSTYHGSAPGVAGLTRAIAKARGAVTQSQQNAQRLQRKSEAVSASSPGSTQARSPSKPGSTSARSAAEAAPSGAGKTHSSAPIAPVKPARAGVPAMQVKVEGQLKQGKLVAILLWNPKGSVDTVVRRELQAAGRTFGGKLAVHVALAPQVGSFGTFTRAVQVYSTPTILIVNPKGIASSVTGLTDAFSIEQAVREAKQAH